MQEEIIVKSEVFVFLDNVVDILLEKEYFSYEETAREYVDKILDFIYNDLSNTKHRPTPKVLLKHGSFFTKYNAGKRTAWYIFFNKKQNKYIIKYITNNHIAKAAFLKHFN